VKTLVRGLVVVPLVGALIVVGIFAILPRLSYTTESTPRGGDKWPTPAVTRSEIGRVIYAEATATKAMGVTLIYTSSVHGGPKTAVNVQRYTNTFRYPIVLLRGETVSLQLIVVPLRAAEERFSVLCWFLDRGKHMNQRGLVIPAGPARLDPLDCRYTTTG